MDGLLLIDKPVDWTSHDVVAKVRGVLSKEAGQKVKVGHIGTLDPAATGLLVLVVGKYTKKVPEFMKLDKVYKVEMTLGKTSTTQDREGEITETNQPIPDEETVKEKVNTFVGEIEQIPPAHSAIKINGKRAYKLAREGVEVKIEPRQVTIYSIDDIQVTGDKVTFTTKVSSGTYIRSLVRDMGEKLGCGAYMSALRRTQIGDWHVGKAVAPTKELVVVTE
ncbi:MAG: tRNA pseudouridine(55) synthase TruB [bacterium]|nr:tRNA pseudouridine(55) synthase TruB [bacterium]